MASAEFIISKDSLECSICAEVYIDKDPRTLPCQHTFCFECLQRFVKLSPKQIVCPNCRAPFQLPNRDVNKLTKNLTCAQIKSRVSSDFISCKKHNKEGSLFCLSHNESNLCSECFYQDHLKCEIKPIKYRKDTLNQYSSVVNDNQDKIMEKIQQKEDEIIKKIKEKFNKIREEVRKKANVKKATISEIFNRKDSFENNLKEIKIISESDFEVNINEFTVEIITKDNNKPSTGNINNKFCNFSDIKPDFIILPEEFTNRSYISIRLKNNSKILASKIFLADNPKFDNIFGSLKDCLYLTEFKINCTRITEKEFSDLCEGLAKFSKTLNTLDFNDCNITERQGFHLSRLLEQCKIRRFSLCGSKNLNESMSIICFGLKYSRTELKDLNFNNCQLSVHQIKIIGDFLHSCTNIETFKFASNNLSGGNLTAICAGLVKSAKTLKELNISSCNLDSIDYLIWMLKHCYSIETFDISCNENIKNISNLWSALDSSADSLNNLYLNDCDLKQPDSQKLGNFLKRCKLEILNLCLNPSMNTGLICILKSIRNSAINLKELYFDSENLALNQYDNVIKFLSNCDDMEKLHITFDNIGPGSRDRLGELCDEIYSTSSLCKEIKFVKY